MSRCDGATPCFVSHPVSFHSPIYLKHLHLLSPTLPSLHPPFLLIAHLLSTPSFRFRFVPFFSELGITSPHLRFFYLHASYIYTLALSNSGTSSFSPNTLLSPPYTLLSYCFPSSRTRTPSPLLHLDPYLSLLLYVTVCSHTTHSPPSCLYAGRPPDSSQRV
ncbi:hypothetical protein BOTBODRAFT_313717 [Botryobasidium botryosum FD-172 SS1]|uniref:Uncharacterized protein n=1 Tax=Botryobasidium botryosum (strain FD-172 SS1) TaxID=930990 RepID=A0A067MXZ1_BOTB1|nr:hypothetical protein BOTBODRAFT_313717 [Botryobasidium botryosum FD-172 SS1]